MPLRAKVTSIVCQVQICRGSHAPEGKGDLLCKVKKGLYSAAVSASGPLIVELTTTQELTTAD